MRFPRIAAICFVLLLMTCSCCGSDSVAIPAANVSVTGADASGLAGCHLWGLWQVAWNPTTQEFDAVPLRTAELGWNVTTFIDGPPLRMRINLISFDPHPDYTDFAIDVELIHPFPGLERFTGFDVIGVFMGNGGAQFPGEDAFPIAGPFDQQLMNPDGFTRRFNAAEFRTAGRIMPIQGYHPGRKGTPDYLPTAILNPYKYFADGLAPTGDAMDYLSANPSGRGAFRPGSVNGRRYELRFPTNVKYLFQYAVIANWEPGINHPDPPSSLDDFPISANSEEALLIDVLDSSTAYYVDQDTYGGQVILDIMPWDWSATCSGAMEEYGIRLYSEAWSGAYEVDRIPVDQGDHVYTYHAVVPVETLGSADPLPVWVEVYYPDRDYVNPFGVPNEADGHLATYFLTEVEIWEPGEVWVYGFGDWGFLAFTDDDDNNRLFSNMLTYRDGGPYCDNRKVIFYTGHTNNYNNPQAFQDLAESLGCEYEYLTTTPLTYTDTIDARMLVICTLVPHEEPDFFTAEEVQVIKDLVYCGGVCMVVIDGPYWFQDGQTEVLDQLLIDLGVDFSCPMDMYLHAGDNPYADISEDPITLGVRSLSGNDGGRFEVFGDGMSLVRNEEGYTAICKSAMH